MRQTFANLRCDKGLGQARGRPNTDPSTTPMIRGGLKEGRIGRPMPRLGLSWSRRLRPHAAFGLGQLSWVWTISKGQSRRGVDIHVDMGAHAAVTCRVPY